MQQVQAINTQSTLKGNGDMSSLNPQSQTGSHLPWSYHTLPLNLFIEQVDNGTVDQLIYDEFLHAIKDKEQSYIQRLVKEINILEVKYMAAQVAIQYYDKINDPKIFEVIVQMVVSAQKTDTLELIYTRSKKMLTDLDLKKADLEAVLSKNESGKVDRKYFSHLTLHVSKHLGYQVDKRNTTVAEFADMIVDMRETSELMQNEIKKHNK